MSTPGPINERIEEIVQRWGAAKTLEEAAEILRRSVMRLDRSSMEQTRRVIAEIAIEVLVILLSTKEGTANAVRWAKVSTMYAQGGARDGEAVKYVVGWEFCIRA